MRLLTGVLVLAVWVGLAPGHAFAQPQPVSPEERLSVEMLRLALSTTASETLTSDALHLAALFAREAASLQPDSPDLWRMVLPLATLAEDDDLHALAIERLAQLDPSGENTRLQRLNLALNRYQTAAERSAAYERLLSEESIPSMGAATASRLALDFALLKQREGDIDAFSQWLARALELDRSNRTAAAIAAGFYRANVKDAVGEAELLTNLFLADPTDLRTQIELAQLLLDHGAYRGAFRMFAMATGGLNANRMPPSNELMADFAIAQWAQGDAEGALTTIDHRQMEIDEVFRQQEAAANPRLVRSEIAKLKGPLHPTLASVAAVIKTGRGDRDAEQAVNAAIAAYEATIERARKDEPPPDPAAIAARQLEIAWIALWLGKDSAKPMSLVEAVEQVQPLSDDARKRFDGWKALKDGEPERAMDMLSPLAEKDDAARVGVALALMQVGREKDAARELLALNRSQPGSMIGIWAAGELARILGQRLPLSPQATEMERLIASIPQSVDRYVREGSMVVSVRVTPENTNPGPYQPISLRIDLTNNSSLPLAIDPAGPLRPQLMVLPTLNTATPLPKEIKPFIVDLDTRLRLLPHETASVTVDMRWHPMGSILNAVAVTGGLLKIVVYSNFVVTESASVVPGLYGLEVQAPMVRIDGVRKDEQWLEQAIAMMNDPNAPPAELAVNMALVTNEILHAGVQRTVVPAHKQLLDSAQAAMPDAFARLDPVSQAWFLCVAPQNQPGMESILAMGRKSESRLVRLVYLMFHITGADDPMLDAARRGEDPTLREVAEILSTLLASAAAATQPAKAPSTSASTKPSSSFTRPSVVAPSTAPAAPATAPATTTAPAPVTAPAATGPTTAPH